MEQWGEQRVLRWVHTWNNGQNEGSEEAFQEKEEFTERSKSASGQKKT